VEICLAVADPGRAHGLIQGLAEVSAPASVWFDCARGEVRVRSERQSRAVLRVRDVVESWLAAEGIASAKLSIADYSETLFCPGSGTPVHGARGRAKKSASFGPRAIGSQVKVVDLKRSWSAEPG
jgi:transposase InsO family protein